MAGKKSSNKSSGKSGKSGKTVDLKKVTEKHEGLPGYLDDYLSAVDQSPADESMPPETSQNDEPQGVEPETGGSE